MFFDKSPRIESKMPKRHVPNYIIDMYTDILAHTFDPSGSKIACGTTSGKFFVLKRSGDRHEFVQTVATEIPDGKAVLGLDWAPPGILVGVKNGFHIYPTSDTRVVLKNDWEENDHFVECSSDVMDIRWLDRSNRIAAGCDDGKIRIFDVSTLKLLRTIDAPKETWDRVSAPVEVLAVSEEHFASGRQDGTISVFDKELRSPEPLWNLSAGAKLAPGLALTEDSTWLATGTQGTPTVYNFRTRVAIPPIETEFNNSKSPLPIFSVAFDSVGTLWWGGGGSTIFGSDCLSKVSSSFHTSYGDHAIYHIFSIATGKDSQLSVAGSSNGILFSDNGKYWDTYISLS